MGVPLYVICHFSLVAFNNFSLSLSFVNLITMCFSMFLLGVTCLGLSELPGLGWLFPFPLGKFLTVISSNIFSGPFSLFFWDPYNVKVGSFNVVPEVS